MFNKIIYRFSKALGLFYSRRGSTLAAASSFYVLLTIVPLVLLLLRAVGLFLGDVNDLESHFFVLMNKAFPGVAPDMVNLFRNIISTALFGNQITIFNIVVLVISSLGFFNAIWNGVYLITQDKKLLSPKKHLIGMLILMTAALLLVSSFALPSFVLLIFSIIKQNAVMDYLNGVVPNFSYVLEVVDYFSFVLSAILKSNFFYGMVFLLFFMFVYKWIFSWRISYKGALLASTTFVSGLLLGKGIFVIYFQSVRANLIRNYGDYYTFIALLMWIFVINILFFFGVCLCVIYKDYKEDATKFELISTIIKMRNKLRLKFLLFFKSIKNKILKK